MPVLKLATRGIINKYFGFQFSLNASGNQNPVCSGNQGCCDGFPRYASPKPQVLRSYFIVQGRSIHIRTSFPTHAGMADIPV
jgi:hypothetical protein